MCHVCPFSPQAVLTDFKTTLKNTKHYHVCLCNELCLALGKIIFSLNFYSSVYLPPAVKLLKLCPSLDCLRFFFFPKLFPCLFSFFLSRHPTLTFEKLILHSKAWLKCPCRVRFLVELYVGPIYQWSPLV